MEKLPKNKEEAALLLASGTMDKTDIAKKVGISRTTLWTWETNDENFKAEVDRLKREFKTRGQNFIMGKVNTVLSEIDKLALTAESEKVRLDALKFLAEQAIGKATTKLEVETNVNENNVNVTDDLLELEYDNPNIIDHENEE